MSQPSDEAQRDLEKRALRNVRGLVDKMEGMEAVDRRKQRNMVAAILVVALAAAACLAIWVAMKGKPPPVVIDPANLPPIKAGPQK